MSVKTNAVDLLHKQLKNRARRNQFGFITLASATDPYVKPEAELQITRKLLEVVLEHRFPVHMLTKSDLITRDQDLLKAIDHRAILPADIKQLGRGALISFSFSTLQDHPAKIFEPGATPPTKRLKTVKFMIDKGFKTGISFMPQIPYISDTGTALESAFLHFKELEVEYVLPATITLFGSEKADSKTLMLKAIEKHYPGLLLKYKRLFANSHELPYYYRKAFHQKMQELAQKHQIKLSIL